MNPTHRTRSTAGYAERHVFCCPLSLAYIYSLPFFSLSFAIYFYFYWLFLLFLYYYIALSCSYDSAPEALFLASQFLYVHRETLYVSGNISAQDDDFLETMIIIIREKEAPGFLYSAIVFVSNDNSRRIGFRGNFHPCRFLRLIKNSRRRRRCIGHQRYIMD